MKKYSLTQVILIALVTLIAGFLIAMSIKSIPPQHEEIAGSIGKLERYRNVKVTDDDILLRNELLEDTLKRSQYEKYLTYYYYHAIKISHDLEQVMRHTSSEVDFDLVNSPYASSLKTYEEFLGSARTDILVALNLVTTLNKEENKPIIGYLNLAQNAVARIRNLDAFLLDYLASIEAFLAQNPGKTYPGLENAHDILATNVLLSAIMTQNKPVLQYLNKKKLLNDKEGLNSILSEVQLKDFALQQFAQDVEKIGAVQNAEAMQSHIWNDVEQLHVVAYAVTPLAAVDLGIEEIMKVVVNHTSSMGFFVTDAETMGYVASQNILNSDVFFGFGVFSPFL